MKQRLSLMAAAAVVFMIVAGVASCISADQRVRLEAAVPGFSCDELRIVNTRGQAYWNGDWRRASSGLRMPSECRARLERMVIERGYAVEPCGIGPRCYALRGRSEAYVFTFNGPGTSFSYSRY